MFSYITIQYFITNKANHNYKHKVVLKKFIYMPSISAHNQAVGLTKAEHLVTVPLAAINVLWDSIIYIGSYTVSLGGLNPTNYIH